MLGVEHLQHFAIADVALVSKEGDLKYKSKGQECLLKEDGEEEDERESGAESTTPPPPTIYKYSFKLKFHTKIFGTFKQTLVLDFGVRPLLSKVLLWRKKISADKLRQNSPPSFADSHRRCGCLLSRVRPPVGQGVDHLDQRPLGLDQLGDCQV